MNPQDFQGPTSKEFDTDEYLEFEEHVTAEVGPVSDPEGRRSFLAAAMGAAMGIPFLVKSSSVANAGAPQFRFGPGRSPNFPFPIPPRPIPRRGINRNYVSKVDLARNFRNIFDGIPTFFEDVQKHENDHVDFLVGALGSAARPKPTFQNLEQSSFMNFVTVTQALENTGAGAYLGAAPLIFSKDYLAAAGSIGFIEARHASAVNFILGDHVTVNNTSFENPLTPGEVQSRAGGFIASLNGGPPVNYRNGSSASNDINILNFALALEYLEAEFYNINVPKFFNQYL